MYLLDAMRCWIHGHSYVRAVRYGVTLKVCERCYHTKDARSE